MRKDIGRMNARINTWTDGRDEKAPGVPVEAVPGAEFAVLGDSGHMVMLERPVEVNELLDGLIARVRRDLVSRQGVA